MKTINLQGQGISSRTSVMKMLVSALLGMAAIAPSAQAQGCVLCYTSVAAGGPAAAQAFRWGVLTLLVPALLLFGGIFFLIFRHARTASGTESFRAALPVAPVSPASVTPARNNLMARLRALSSPSGS
jgi:hypothetical protein